MAERAVAGVGGRLRDARVRRGLSLRQVSNATKISVAALEALERNDTARLPGGIFSRAFVRSYALEVGLDPEQALEEFVGQSPVDAVAGGRPAGEEIEDNVALESNRRVAYAVVRLLLVSVPIAGMVAYLGSAASDTYQVVVEPPVPSVQSTAGSVEALAPEAPPVHDLLSTEVLASAPCWVSVEVDGRMTLQRELQTGERHVIEARRELVLKAGNAAALTLTLNGATARPLGRPGQVVTLRLNLSNYRDYLANP
jgi:cytoskeletal protein RodZ